MTLQKAIEILAKFDNGEYSCDAVTFRKAVKLGKEALKYIKACRRQRVPNLLTYLPGETNA